MNLIDALEWRYATKKMNGKIVPDEKVETVLQAIRLAPSSMGLQPYTVLVITDQDLKKEIFNVSKQAQVIDSSHLLVFAAWENIHIHQVEEYIASIAETRNVPLGSLDGFKKNIFSLVNRPQEENFNWAARQAYIAFGTAIAAAAEERIDATPMEGFDSTALDKLLNLQEKGLKSVTLLPLGYRDTENDWLSKAPKVRREKEKLFVFKL
ncbi:MAG: nitroreductase family protein [Cytophagaceae bacterium]